MVLSNVGDVTGGVAINTMVASLLDMSTNVLGFILSNPLLLIMFSGSVVGVASYVVRKVKRTAKA